ncbi:unnamed protein product, partial [Ectocarpus sp. 12 AP-2014]
TSPNHPDFRLVGLCVLKCFRTYPWLYLGRDDGLRPLLDFLINTSIWCSFPELLEYTERTARRSENHIDRCRCCSAASRGGRGSPESKLLRFGVEANEWTKSRNSFRPVRSLAQQQRARTLHMAQVIGTPP